MKESSIAWLIFSFVLITALVIILLSSYDYFKYNSKNEVVKSVKKQSFITAMVVSNPCQFPQCYFPQGKSFCYKEGEIVESAIPDFGAKICVQKENLVCNQGRWVFNKYPEKVCV